MPSKAQRWQQVGKGKKSEMHLKASKRLGEKVAQGRKVEKVAKGKKWKKWQKVEE